MNRSVSAIHAHLSSIVRQRSERGATMVEYGLLMTFIALVAVAGVKLLGPVLRALFISFAAAF